MILGALAVRETAREPWAEDEGPPPGSGTHPETRLCSEDTELEELGDEIAVMAAHMHAYRRRYLARVAEFDRRRGWEPSGHGSCARWLSFRTGCDLNTAREHL